MITIFVKFTNHADELLNGHIRMNPLEYYRGVEKILSGNTSELDNPAVYDVLEGSAGYIPILEKSPCIEWILVPFQILHSK